MILLQTSFIALTLALAIVLYLMTVRVSLMAFTNEHHQKRFMQRTGAVLVCWLIYVSAISVTGIFASTRFPPRIPLLLVAPAFLFFFYFFISKKFKLIIANTPHAWPVYFQSFRVAVELLIWGAYMKGVLPQSATFEGHNFDILIGLTAPLVAFFTFTKPRIGRVLFILWNLTGLLTLAVVVAILMRHSYFVKNERDSILYTGFGAFPFTFLAGFYMPLAVFMHVLSLVKTRKEYMLP